MNVIVPICVCVEAPLSFEENLTEKDEEYLGELIRSMFSKRSSQLVKQNSFTMRIPFSAQTAEFKFKIVGVDEK